MAMQDGCVKIGSSIYSRSEPDIPAKQHEPQDRQHRHAWPSGFGLDMTDAMLELAEGNPVEAGRENVRLLKGVVEDT